MIYCKRNNNVCDAAAAAVRRRAKKGDGSPMEENRETKTEEEAKGTGNASAKQNTAENATGKVQSEGAAPPAGGAASDGQSAESAGKTRSAHRVNLLVNVVAAVLLLGVFVFVFLYFYDYFEYLGTPEGRQVFIEKLRETGAWGVVILTLVQVLQVVVAFIPGEVVELASGALYGMFGGLVLCLVGLNIGTLIIFGLVSLLGGSYVRENVSQKQYKYLKILNDPDRALVALFFIFLIPGIPKDILIYFVPLTRVKMWKFMIVASVARIPSIVSSTFTAEALLRGDYLSAGIIFGIFLVLGILGVVFNGKIYALVEKIFARDKKK